MRCTNEEGTFRLTCVDMDIDSERLKIAHWVLERNLHWIAASEVKTGVIVAIDTAMLGSLAAAYSSVPVAAHTAYAGFFAAVAAVCLGFGVFCAAMVVLPRVTGPTSSFLFFGCIAKTPAADFAEAFRNASHDQLLTDCLAQIHRNAEIATAKFQWVRDAMAWSFLAVLPWLAALTVLLWR